MISEFNREERKSDSEEDPHLDTVMEMTLEDTKNDFHF